MSGENFLKPLMGLIRKTLNHGYIIYTNLFNLVSNTSCIVLHRKQICYIQSRRFDRFDRILHVVSIAKYTNVISNYNSICHCNNMGIIKFKCSLGEV